MRKLMGWLLVMLLAVGCGSAEGRVLTDAEPFAEGTPLLELFVCPLLGADSMVLRQGEHAMLIDMGKKNDLPKIRGVLDDLGLTHFDYAFNTHPHTDHLGAMAALAEAYRFDRFVTGFDENVTGKDVIQRSTIQALRDAGIEIVHMDGGDTFMLGDARLTVVRQATNKGFNAQSMMLLVEYGACRMLLGADVTGQAQDYIAREYDVRADILKYPHHGINKLTDSFLEEVNPSYAILTHGSVNTQPAQQVLDKAGVPYGFATWGVLHLSTDGQVWHVDQDILPDMQDYVERFLKQKNGTL